MEPIAEIDGARHREGGVVLALVAGIPADDGAAEHQPLGHRAGGAVPHEDVEEPGDRSGPDGTGEQQASRQPRARAQGANRGMERSFESGLERGREYLPRMPPVKPVFIVNSSDSKNDAQALNGARRPLTPESRPAWRQPRWRRGIERA